MAEYADKSHWGPAYIKGAAGRFPQTLKTPLFPQKSREDAETFRMSP